MVALPALMCKAERIGTATGGSDWLIWPRHGSWRRLTQIARTCCHHCRQQVSRCVPHSMQDKAATQSGFFLCSPFLHICGTTSICQTSPFPRQGSDDQLTPRRGNSTWSVVWPSNVSKLRVGCSKEKRRGLVLDPSLRTQRQDFQGSQGDASWLVAP